MCLTRQPGSRRKLHGRCCVEHLPGLPEDYKQERDISWNSFGKPSWISFGSAWNQFLWSSRGSLLLHPSDQWTRNNFRLPNLETDMPVLYFASRNLYLRHINPQFLMELLAQRSWFRSAPAHGHPLAGCNSTCRMPRQGISRSPTDSLRQDIIAAWNPTDLFR